MSAALRKPFCPTMALAKKTGLNREHLFRMLSKSGNPQLHSLRQLAEAIGMKLVLQPA